MKNRLNSKPVILFFSGLILLLASNAFCADQKPQTIAILPFEIISPDDISYIRSGSLQMLHSRLRWKGHVQTVDRQQVKSHLADLTDKNPNRVVKKIADRTGCDYVLTGSIIQFADAFSIDTKIIDVKNKKYLTFSEQSQKLDDVIPKINLLAAKINKKVFQRETQVYENLIKKEKEKAEQWKRQNPEKLMPVFPQGPQEEKSSIWRFWEYL